jgi:hypothetical protein
MMQFAVCLLQIARQRSRIGGATSRCKCLSHRRFASSRSRRHAACDAIRSLPIEHRRFFPSSPRKFFRREEGTHDKPKTTEQPGSPEASADTRSAETCQTSGAPSETSSYSYRPAASKAQSVAILFRQFRGDDRLQEAGEARGHRPARLPRPRSRPCLARGLPANLVQEAGKDSLAVGDVFPVGPRQAVVVGIMRGAATTFGSEVWAKRLKSDEIFGKENLCTSIVLAERWSDLQACDRATPPAHTAGGASGPLIDTHWGESSFVPHLTAQTSRTSVS